MRARRAACRTCPTTCDGFTQGAARSITLCVPDATRRLGAVYPIFTLAGKSRGLCKLGVGAPPSCGLRAPMDIVVGGFLAFKASLLPFRTGRDGWVQLQRDTGHRCQPMELHPSSQIPCLLNRVGKRSRISSWEAPTSCWTSPSLRQHPSSGCAYEPRIWSYMCVNKHVCRYPCCRSRSLLLVLAQLFLWMYS